ncbi:hypothetical protein Y032_0007g3431 [Ancylostoma ceylanicum]|uniref:Uncharacterized protein n=1 Tax=Ancylostoma ceylanicum TaxID=53326 RepID=A0A016VPU2_9BILA|nr:hypothetical protein Y032_0007g3431 [Ancylostoma ceylanicum]
MFSFQQWLEGKRIISHITLIGTKALNRDQLLEGVDPSKIQPWPEGPSRKEDDYRAKIRNDAGDLITIYVGSGYCELTDPLSDEA